MKTLSNFIEEAARKKAEPFVDMTPNTKSNPIEPEISMEEAEGLHEMEKDLRNGQRWDYDKQGRRGPDKTAKAITSKKATKSALDVLNKHLAKEDVELDEEKLSDPAKASGSKLADNLIGADDIKKNANGTHRVYRGFFYRHGSTSEGHADRISKGLKDLGVEHDVVDHGTQDYKPFKGGASVRTQNHHWVDVRIKPGQKVKLDESTDDMREQKISHGGKHVATIRTFRGRAGGWMSSTHNPDGSDASKKYDIGLNDTKKQMVSKIKQYHSRIDEGSRWDTATRWGGRLARVGTAADIGSSAATGWNSDPNASTNRRAANATDAALSHNSGNMAISSRTVQARVAQPVRSGYRAAQRVVAPARAAAGAARDTQAIAARAATSAAERAATRGIVRTGARAIGTIASKAAWPLTLGMAAWDATKGYNAQPNAPFTRKLRNAGQNAVSGLTLGLVPAPEGVNESWETALIKGAKALAPIAKKAVGALERRVAAKAAAAARGATTRCAAL